MTLLLEILNHFGGTSEDYVLPEGPRHPFRLVGLPQWQLDIINAYPALYLSDENMGVADYCHLALGFQCSSVWAQLLCGMSDKGSSLVSELRASGLQPDARIAVVRVVESKSGLRFGINTHLREPFHTVWRNYIQSIGAKFL